MTPRTRFRDGVRTYAIGLDQPPPWVLPWLAPTGQITRAALAALDRPILAWENDDFDAADFYSQFPAEEMNPLQRDVAALGERPTWRLERVWLPDEESTAAEAAAYDRQCREIDGVLLAPRCLDAYVTQAYQAAGLIESDDDPVHADIDPEDLDLALEWAAAGVCVLQQSLPWPFQDMLLYAELDNRPAHRILYAYAALLARRHPRKAAPWWRAMVYLNPPDNLGARFHAPRSPRKAVR